MWLGLFYHFAILSLYLVKVSLSSITHIITSSLKIKLKKKNQRNQFLTILEINFVMQTTLFKTHNLTKILHNKTQPISIYVDLGI